MPDRHDETLRARRRRIVLDSWNASWNAGDVDYLDRVTHPDFRRYTSTGARGDSHAQSLTELKADIVAIRDGFPDVETTIHELLIDGDKVAVRWSAEGTHDAAFMSAPPTGRRVHVSGVTISRFEGDLIREEWVTWNRVDLLLRLGIVPIGLEA